MACLYRCVALFMALLCAYFSVRAGMMQCIKPRVKTARLQGVTYNKIYICGLEGNQCTRPADAWCDILNAFSSLRFIAMQSKNGCYLSWLLLVLSCRPCKDLRCPVGFSPPVHQSHCFCSGHSGAWSSTLEGLVCPSLL